MFISRLSLVNFKNHREFSLETDKRFVGISGRNGRGKTNILDALHYLCFCRSYFNPIDSQNIAHGEDFFVVQAKVKRTGSEIEEEVFCSVKKGQRKIMRLNKAPYEKLADHIGKMPAVVISPYDQDLVQGGSESRRRFVDMIIAQGSRVYLDQLSQYKHVLQQRNSLLKYFWENNTFQSDMLEVYDEQLFELNKAINGERQKFYEAFNPVFNRYYAAISGSEETVGAEYSSQVNSDSLRKLFADSLSKDKKKWFTHVGIHKDDLEFTLGGFPLKKFGSQGQQKTFLVALKLAQFEFVEQITGEKPLLLLDDIFDKLDEKRVANLVKLVGGSSLGQTFITHTESKTMRSLFSELGAEADLVHLEKHEYA